MLRTEVPQKMRMLRPDWVTRMLRHFEAMEALSENQRSFHAQLCQLQIERGQQLH